MGRDLNQLDAYFSCIVVCQLPNIKTTAVTDDGRMLLGSELFSEQVTKVRTLLASLLNSRMADRDNRLSGAGGPGRRIITSRQGLWYSMLPRIVERLNSGEPVHVARLVDEAWAESISQLDGQEAPLDIFKSFVTYARPSPALSNSGARAHEDYLLRFAGFCELLYDVSVRLVAARMRHMDKGLLFDDKVDNAARPQLEAALTMLADMTPCRAVYGEGHKGAPIELGVPVERPDEPVLCLQEHRVHIKSHRGCRRVKGGGSSMWQRLLSVLPYNPTWAGDFEPALVARPDLYSMLEEVRELLRISVVDFYAQLLDLQMSHSSMTMTIEFAPLEGALPAPTAGSESADAGPLRIRHAKLESPIMPYCIGCGRKTLGSSADHAKSAGIAAGAHASLGAGEHEDAGDSDSSPGYRSWATALLGDFFTIAAAEASHLLGLGKGGAAASKSVTFSPGKPDEAPEGLNRHVRRGGMKRSLAFDSGDAPASILSQQAAPIVTQHVVFGLCKRCVTVALQLNLKHQQQQGATEAPVTPV
jgi:hypothetical protein